MRASMEKAGEEVKELRTKLDAINDKLEALDAETIQFPQFPHIMVGMLAEGTFEQRNAVYKDVLKSMTKLLLTSRSFRSDLSY